MPTVIGIRFRRAGKLYYFSPGDHDFEIDDYAVVNSGNSRRLARVVLAPTELATEELKNDLKEVERKGT
ncbi:MAG: stage 0 sporulation protein, partial [Chloroflexi bacterium]|nr:stage 0 sporulation protein [Chloroflexota bacterium]